MESSGALPVLMDAWVLQDGNYRDFEAGSRREFALEVHADWYRRLVPDPGGTPGWEPTGSAGEIRVTADVVFVSTGRRDPGCVVVDFGVRGYALHPLVDSGPPAVGDRLTGVLSVGVDPFFYFEELTGRQPAIPELIYRWDVRAVEIDESPLLTIPYGDPRFPPYLPASEGPAHIRDRSRERWRAIDRTRMWDDVPDGGGVYRLACVRTGEPPTHAFRFPRR